MILLRSADRPVGAIESCGKAKKGIELSVAGSGAKRKKIDEVKEVSSERRTGKGTLGEYEQCRLLEYKSHMDMMSSDHKPVSALLRCKVKSHLPSRYLETHAQIIRELDKFENEIQPDATISMTSLDFGSVKYLVPQTRTITMENTGKVITQFRFLKFEQAGGGSFAQIDGSAKKGESDPRDGVSRPWMYISPSMGMLVPGEKIEIELSIVIDNASAEKLNVRGRNIDSASSPTATDAAVDDVAPRLDDTLILHLENGKDFFIAIVGSFDKTCFAFSLERLVRLRSPVRFDDGAGWENKNQATAPKSVPTELWRMIDFLWKHAMEVDDLFILSGDQTTMAYIRECLDSGADFDYDRLLNDSGVTNVADPGEIEVQTEREVSERSTTLETATGLHGQNSTPPPLPLRPPPLQLSHLSPMTSREAMPAVRPTTPVSPASPSDEHLGIHSMAETLLRFLESLPEPVIPFALQPRCLEAASVLGTVGLDACKASLAFLPSTHFNVFLYVVSFLKEVVRSAKRRRRRRREEGRNVQGDNTSEDSMDCGGAEKRRRGSTTSLVPGDEVSEAESYTDFGSQLEDTMVVKKLAVIFSSILLRPQNPPASGDRFAESAARKRRIYLAHFLEGGTDDDDEDEEDDESEEESPEDQR